MVTSLHEVASETDLNRLALIFRTMVQSFGGMERFLELWAQTYEHSAPGSFTRLRCLKPVLTIWRVSAEERAKREKARQKEIDHMSEEDLTSSLQAHLRELIAEQPELASAALADRGWTVIPPKDE